MASATAGGNGAVAKIPLETGDGAGGGAGVEIHRQRCRAGEGGGGDHGLQSGGTGGGLGAIGEAVGGIGLSAISIDCGHGEGHEAVDEIGLAGDSGVGGVAGLAEQAIVEIEAITLERGLVGRRLPDEGKEFGTGGGCRSRACG